MDRAYLLAVAVGLQQGGRRGLKRNAIGVARLRWDAIVADGTATAAPVGVSDANLLARVAGQLAAIAGP